MILNPKVCNVCVFKPTVSAVKQKLVRFFVRPSGENKNLSPRWLSCLHDVRKFFPFSKSHLDYVNHGIIAASVFRQLFFGNAVCGVAVFRAPQCPPYRWYWVSRWSTGGERRNRNVGKRAAKGDAKGKTNGCLTTKRHRCYLPRIIHELLLTTEP